MDEFLTNFTLSVEAKEEIVLDSKDIRNLKELTEYNFDSRYVCNKTGQVYRVKSISSGRIIGVAMNPFITRDGYVEYVLTDRTGRKKHIQAQRIVAGLFLPKILGKDYVNHKSGVRDDNSVDNLEWVTASENIQHSWDKLRRR